MCPPSWLTGPRTFDPKAARDRLRDLAADTAHDKINKLSGEEEEDEEKKKGKEIAKAQDDDEDPNESGDDHRGSGVMELKEFVLVDEEKEKKRPPRIEKEKFEPGGSKAWKQLCESVQRYSQDGSYSQGELEGIGNALADWKETKNKKYAKSSRSPGWHKSKNYEKAMRLELALSHQEKALPTAQLLADIEKRADRDTKAFRAAHWAVKHGITKSEVVGTVRYGISEFLGLDGLLPMPKIEFSIGTKGLELTSKAELTEWAKGTKKTLSEAHGKPSTVAEGYSDKASKTSKPVEAPDIGGLIQAELDAIGSELAGQWKNLSDKIQDLGSLKNLTPREAFDKLTTEEEKKKEADEPEDDKKESKVKATVSELFAAVDEEAAKCLAHQALAEKARAELEPPNTPPSGGSSSGPYTKLVDDDAKPPWTCEDSFAKAAVAQRYFHHREKAKYYLAPTLALLQVTEELLRSWAKDWEDNKWYDLTFATDHFHKTDFVVTNNQGDWKISHDGHADGEVACYASADWKPVKWDVKQKKGYSSIDDANEKASAQQAATDEANEKASTPFTWKARRSLGNLSKAYDDLSPDSKDATANFKKAVLAYGEFVTLTVQLHELADEIGLERKAAAEEEEAEDEKDDGDDKESDEDKPKLKVIADKLLASEDEEDKKDEEDEEDEDDEDENPSATLSDALKELGFDGERGKEDEEEKKGNDEDPAAARMKKWLELGGFTIAKENAVLKSFEKVSSKRTWGYREDQEFRGLAALCDGDRSEQFALMLLHIHFREEKKTYTERAWKSTKGATDEVDLKKVVAGTIGLGVTAAAAATGVPILVYRAGKMATEFAAREYQAWSDAFELRSKAFDLASGEGSDVEITADQVLAASEKVQTHVLSAKKNLERLQRGAPSVADCNEVVAYVWAAAKLKHHFEKVAFYRLILAAFALQVLGDEAAEEYGAVKRALESCRDDLERHVKYGENDEYDVACRTKKSRSRFNLGTLFKRNKATHTVAKLCYGKQAPTEEAETDETPLLQGRSERGIVIKPMHLTWQHRASKGYDKAKDFKEKTEKNATKWKKKAVKLRKRWDSALKELDTIAPPTS